MRTNIDIDDELLAEAMRVSGIDTKKAVVEEALKCLVRVAKQQDALEALRGMGWEGDLDQIRDDWDESRDWGAR